jgi:mycothiol synthase
MTVTLRPMTDAELSARLVDQIDDYADDLVKAGQATPEDARERSTAAHAALLPDGVRTVGHLVFRGEVDGTTVGSIWLTVPGASPVRPDLSWIFNVEIDPAYRGKGYGRAILLAGEREMRGRGVTRMGLNVFAHNPVARRLYDSLGYELTTRQMVKTLTPSAAPPAVSLRAMAEGELRAWLAAQAPELARQFVEAGEATVEAAPAMVDKAIAARLPDGVATPGMLAYAGEVERRTVGHIWAALPGSGGQQRPGTAWIYYVEVDDAQRGNGYGRGLIEALEHGLVARGVPRLGLNVLGSNTVAGRLYDSMDFQVTAQQMAKSLT